jgi:hypothetical protein
MHGETNIKNDVQNFYKAQKRQSNTVAHILSLKYHKLFGKNRRIEYSLSDQYHLAIERHNEEVKKTRAVLAHLIRVVCVLGKLGLAFRGHDESVTSVNRGNYVEMQKLVANYDAGFRAHIEGNCVFRKLT